MKELQIPLMEYSNLENGIREKLSLLDRKLSTQEKNNFQLKSLQNFVIHIFDKELNNDIEKSKLKKMNLKRNQDLILEYVRLQTKVD